VYFLFLFLLLFGHIATFTPILDKRLLKDMQTLVALNPGQEATFQVFTKRLRVVGDLHYLEFPLSEIQTMRRLPHGLALYLNAQIILTIPGSPENTDEELDRLYHFIRLAKGRK